MDQPRPKTKLLVDRQFHLCGAHGVSRTTCYSLKGLGGPCAPCPIVSRGARVPAEALDLDPYTDCGDWIRVTVAAPGQFLCERNPLPASATHAISAWRERNLLQGMAVEQAANKLQAIQLAVSVLKKHELPGTPTSRFVDQIQREVEELECLLGLAPGVVDSRER